MKLLKLTSFLLVMCLLCACAKAPQTTPAAVITTALHTAQQTASPVYTVSATPAASLSPLYTGAKAEDDYADGLKGAYPLTEGSCVCGLIENGRDTDCFVFTPESDGFYTLRSYGQTDTAAELFDSDGEWLATDDSSAGNMQFLINRRLKAGEKYFLKVRGYNEKTIGAYEVKITAEEIKIDAIGLIAEETTLLIGQSERVICDIRPAYASDKRLSWKTSDCSVATVKDGLVTAVGTGSAVITATGTSGAAAVFKVNAVNTLPAKRSLSGAAWCGKYPDMLSIEGLEPQFKQCASRFIDALEAAGCQITIESTLRPKERAYLMHWAYQIAYCGYSPKEVPPCEQVGINWWHGSRSASVEAAREMVRWYDIVYQPALESRHIEGKAIDMKITWEGTIKVKDASGSTVTLSSPRSNFNSRLIQLGRSYGVYRHMNGDYVHWSCDSK